MKGYQNSLMDFGNMPEGSSFFEGHSSVQRAEVCIHTFAGDVMFAGRGETSAAVAVDGCYPELVPALRPQI